MITLWSGMQNMMVVLRYTELNTRQSCKTGENVGLERLDTLRFRLRQSTQATAVSFLGADD